MEWQSILSVILVLGWVLLVLILVSISTYRCEKKIKSDTIYILYKFRKGQYSIVRKEHYLPAHSLILYDHIIKYCWCDSAAEAMELIVKTTTIKRHEIFNATEEEI